MRDIYKNRTLADLNALHTAVTNHLARFLEVGNIEQSITYAIEQAQIAQSIQEKITSDLEALRASINQTVALLSELTAPKEREYVPSL